MVGLSERVRTRVEAFGRVELRDTEAAALVRSKAVHMVLVVATVLAVVSAIRVQMAPPVMFLAFWLGGVFEAVIMPRAGVAEKVQDVGKATGAAVLGTIGFFSMIFMAGLL